MSRKFLTNLDLNSNELRNGVIHNLATDPAGKAGQLYYNTVDNELKYYDGGASAWVSLTSVDAEVIEDAVAELLAAGSGISLDYNDAGGTLTIANTGVTSVTGTANEVTVSASAGAVTIGLPDSITADVTGDLTGNADTASELATARTISLGGSLSGSVSFDGSQNVTLTADIVADSVALGTDTTGDYVAGASASGAGISVTGSGGEGSTITIENTGVTSVAGTASQVSVSASTGAVTFSLPSTINVDTSGNAATADNADSADTVKTVTASNTNASYYVTFVDANNGSATSESVYTDDAIYYNPGTNKLTTGHIQATGDVDVDGNLVVDGNLTVSGSVTTLNTETLLVEDNQVTLNSNVTGTPTVDAGIEVERGDSTNASLIWDESADKWAAGLIGSETAISLEGHTHVATDVTDFDTAVDAEIDDYLTGSDSISIISGSIDATLAASASYLTKVGGLAVDKANLETALEAD
jgi:cytoskeletal protein CcmA (bactofilin family)